MRHTCFHTILLATVVMTAAPNVGLAKSPFSMSRSGGMSKAKSFSQPKMSGQISMPSGNRLSNFGGTSQIKRSPTIPSTGKNWSNFGGTKPIQTPTLRNPNLSGGIKPNLGQKIMPTTPRITNPTTTIGKIPSNNLPKIGTTNPAFNAGRLGNLSNLPNLKNLNVQDLGRAKQLGLIQGPGTVEGLKNLAGKIQDGKMAGATLQKIDKNRLGHILKLGQATMSGQQKSAACAAAKKYCGLSNHCHWWFDVICGSHWHNHGCHWDYWCYPVYWKCWTPCHWNVVYCPTTVGHVSASYYFGVEGVMIPDMAAFGIQEVKPGSPAERYGLQPGMMIVAVNGRAMNADSVMVEAIQLSGGRLDLEVLAQGADQPQPLTVILDLVPRNSF